MRASDPAGPLKNSVGFSMGRAGPGWAERAAQGQFEVKNVSLGCPCDLMELLVR